MVGHAVAAAILGDAICTCCPVNTDCALSFIKPVRQVFNLKLLLEGGRKKRGAGKNVGVIIRENSSKLDHVLEK